MRRMRNDFYHDLLTDMVIHNFNRKTGQKMNFCFKFSFVNVEYKSEYLR